MAANKPKMQLTQFAAVAQGATGTQEVLTISVEQIYAGTQIRKKFVDIEDLAESLKEKGLLQNIVVHSEADGRYRIIAGERRWRAAKLAGMQTLRCFVHRNLSDEEFRGIQVAENDKRSGLTAHEKVMGVILDVETRGIEAACRIHKIQESGISKFMAFKRHPAEVQALLEGEFTNDIELLNSLAKLHELSIDRFNEFATMLRDGEQVRRQEVRDALALLKDWNARQEQQGTTPDQTQQDQAPASNDSQEEVDQVDTNTEQNDTPGTLAAASTSIASEALQASSGETLTHPVEKAKPAAKKPLRPEKTPTEQEEQMITLREEIFEAGTLNKTRLKEITELMSSMKLPQDEAEWILWDALLSTILPILATLSKTQSAVIVRKLQDALKQKNAADIYDELHPLPRGQQDDIDRKALAVRPADWKRL